MVLTLDEHIKKAEEDAAQAESDSDWGFGNYFIDRTEAVEYAENCRQLAEWLKELEASRRILEGYGLYYRDGRFYSKRAYEEMLGEKDGK